MSVVETLIVPAGKVGSTLTDFVTRVDLSHMHAAWWADTTSDLGNVRVKSAGSVVPFDIVSYDRTAKTGELFFKATLTTSANTFTVETVTSATALPATDTNGRNNVWVDYLAVVMAADTINRVNGNSPAATAGTITNSTTGLFTFDGTQRITFTVTKPTTWTMGFSGASTVLDTSGVSRGALQVNTESQVGDGDREVLGIRDTTGNDPFGLWNTTDSWLVSTADVTLSRERIHAQHNGTTSRTIWRGGVLDATDTTVVAKPSNTGTAFQIAGRNGDTGAQRWVGTLGYAYLRNQILSADWLAAEVLSWETPSSFYYVPADATVTPPAAAATASASAPVLAASSTVTPPAASSSGSGAAPVVAADAGVNAPAATSTASARTPAVTTTGDVSILAPAATATADAVAPSISAGSSVDAPVATATADGAAPVVSFTASANVSAPAATASASAAGPYVFNGSPDATVTVPAATATASALAPTVGIGLESDVSNAFNGRSRSGFATVTVTVPVVAAPASTSRGTKVDKAVPLPLPTLVNGRPT